MGGAVSSGENNDQLVDNLIRANYIKSPEVERVFRSVDRAFYYTEDERATAYKDMAWKNRNLHLSAPCIYSQVMESLELKEGLSFLNIGSGTGYLSTMVGLILGSKGINHGLEIHPEVIEYAQERLRMFIKMNSAMDEYEFCIPQFERGNCLSLGSTDRLYNRIYCGAACPDNYYDYIKQLVSIGGILVMPVNDQLLQIKRIDASSWTVNSVLAVSFASLVLPSQELTEDASLPRIDPHSLQNLCRFGIRSILKHRVQMEHPDLWHRSRKHPKEIKRSILGQCVVPLFTHSDSDSDDFEAEEEEEEEENQQNVEESSSNESSDQDMATQEPSDRRAGVRLAETLSDTEDEGAKSKREKIDSGVSDLFESSSERSRPSSSSHSPSSANSQSTGSSSSTSTVPTNASSDEEARNEEELAIGAAEEIAQSVLSGIRLFTHSIAGDRDRAALVILESHLDEEETSTDSSEDEGRLAGSGGNRNGDPSDGSSRITPAENYSYYMKQNLLQLPLPLPLKSFLNYDRAF